MNRVLTTAASSIADALERHPGRAILLLTLAAACLNLSALGLRGVRPRIVRGDAVQYYVYARSLVFDRDLDFENDLEGLYSLDFSVEPPAPGFTWDFGRTPTGRVRNYMAIGTPLTWMPLYLAVAGGVAAWNAGGGHYPMDGYGLAFQLVPSVSGIAAGGLALWFTFLLCREFARGRDALLGTLAAGAGTSFVYYMLVAPSYSHAVSACVASGFVLFWWKTRDDAGPWRYVGLGAIGGLLSIVRWQDALVMAVVAFDVVAQARLVGGWKQRLRFGAVSTGLAAAAWLVSFTPQLLAWRALYGQPFTIPQGGDFMRWWDPALASVLASPFRGWFSWTPIAAAGLLAVPSMWRRSKRLALTAAYFIGVSIYVNAAVADWWAGEAFGARRFLSCFPVVALGVTLLATGTGRRPRATRALFLLLVGANLLLLLHYETFMLGYRSLAAYPDNWWTLWVGRFVTPVTLIRQLF
jgi:hypothetical protein